MSDTEEATAETTPPAESPKKTGKVKAPGGSAPKKPKAKPTHPKTADMVNAAIKDLKERGGSSLHAIKKYIAANYKVDTEKVAPFIRKYLKAAVTSGSLVQTKGKGASGSFKIAAPEKKKEAKNLEKNLSKTVKPKGASKPKKEKAVTKKPSKKSPETSPKKKPSPPKKAATKAKSAATKAKTTAKSPTKKPKAPKPKKASSSPKPKIASKKAASSKK